MNSRTRPKDEDGYELWLRYARVDDEVLQRDYASFTARIHVSGSAPSLLASRRELERALPSLIGRAPTFVDDERDATLLVFARESRAATGPDFATRSTLDVDGFDIEVSQGQLRVEAKRPLGALYGVFHLLLKLRRKVPVAQLATRERPAVGLRMLNHWDNPLGTIERGYAGFSIWDWPLLPEYVDPRVEDYARAMASLGLNAASLINVNSDARILSDDFLGKVAVLADVFRPYGVRVFLTARFSAPVELGATSTADPLDASVQTWWANLAKGIYERIPDFAGFLVKANSEGQPGPHEYQRSHADGANVLARALAPYGGVVAWRAFVYDDAVPVDRAMQAYDEFKPLDGRFEPNVLLQIKNGPIDFQPREPFHPLFGALKETSTMLELQLTQEYTGQGTHLVYLGPLFREVLSADTHAKGPSSWLSRAVDGSLHGVERTGIAAVSNMGSARNWCGHPFAQANWYAFGRLAWNPEADVAELAKEWLELTFGGDPEFVAKAQAMMMSSHETCVNTMTPLGLHHLMAKGHHYGPGPWVDEGRRDWTAVYYHRADATGLGFDRTRRGSGAVEQYFPAVRDCFDDPTRCPLELLLWFHHLPWDRELPTGRNLFDELCHRYQQGALGAALLCEQWAALEPHVDARRFRHVESLLRRQSREARFWASACIAYFQTFAERPLAPFVDSLEHSLAHYRSIASFPVAGAPWLK